MTDLNQFRLGMVLGFVLLMSGMWYLSVEYPQHNNVWGMLAVIFGNGVIWTYWAARPRQRRSPRQTSFQIHNR